LRIGLEDQAPREEPKSVCSINLKNMNTKNTFIIHTKTAEQENALKAFAKALKIKFEVAKEKPYDPEFVAKIQESRQQAKEGKATRVKKENLKEFLGL